MESTMSSRHLTILPSMAWWNVQFRHSRKGWKDWRGVYWTHDLCDSYSSTVSRHTVLQEYHPQNWCLEGSSSHNSTSVSNTVDKSPDDQESTPNKPVTSWHFKVGDCVYVWNYHSGPKWVLGQVVLIEGSALYQVKLTNGCTQCRHIVLA